MNFLLKSLKTSYLSILILVFLISCGEKRASENLKKGISEKNSTQNRELIINPIEEKKEIKPLFPSLYMEFRTKNLIIKINPSESPFLENPFTDSEILLNKMCDTIRYTHFPVAERAKVIEKYSLKKDTRSVFRKDASLYFKLKNGKIKILTNNSSGGEAYVNYYYRDYLKEIGFFVCFIAPWEGANYMLINDQTGEEFRVNGIPKISKDKKRILTTPYDAGYYFNDGSLNIWRIENNTIKSEFSYGSNILIWNAEWVDNQTIRFEVLPENQNGLECFGKTGMEALSVHCKKAFELKITQK